jgi:hypothetical protein
MGARFEADVVAYGNSRLRFESTAGCRPLVQGEQVGRLHVGTCGSRSTSIACCSSCPMDAMRSHAAAPRVFTRTRRRRKGPATCTDNTGGIA